MERHYEEKLESMRREMEIMNEHEKSKLKMELEKLRVDSPTSIPNVTMEEELELSSSEVENDPYNIMKSVAFAPFVVKNRAQSFNIKDITGVPAPNGSDSSTPVRTLHFSPSPSPQASLDPELPLLSPATGQHNTAALPVSESPVNSEMKQLLETYEVVQVGEASGTLAISHTVPVDTTDGTPDISASGAFDIGYVSRNMSRFEVDRGMSKSCPAHAEQPLVPGQPDNNSAHQLQ